MFGGQVTANDLVFFESHLGGRWKGQSDSIQIVIVQSIPSLSMNFSIHSWHSFRMLMVNKRTHFEENLTLDVYNVDDDELSVEDMSTGGDRVRGMPSELQTCGTDAQ